MDNVLVDLKYRGLIKDFSSEDEVEKLLSKKQTIYCGFDPSAVSMHIGNLVPITILMRLQKAGHRIVALVGGATGMIGDPSGKSKERNLLDKKAIEANTQAIRKQLSRFLDLEDPQKGILVNNYDWFSSMNMLDYLRDYGKYFPINYLLNKEIIASRLESGISYTEFSYTIMQAIDFYTLHKKYGCNIQIGGSDQWGNLTSGLELIRKIEGNETEAGAMTTHLILDSNGKKFGKSEGGALYLDAKLTSPYKLYQYFINVGDEDAIKYLKIFSFLNDKQISSLNMEHQANLGARIAQKALAMELVSLIHSKEKAQEAKMMSEVLFSGNVKQLSKDNIEELLGLLKMRIHSDVVLEELLVLIKAASSKREAKEFIGSGSISINGEKCLDLSKIVSKKDTMFDEYVIIRRGKKNYYLVELI